MYNATYNMLIHCNLYNTYNTAETLFINKFILIFLVDIRYHLFSNDEIFKRWTSRKIRPSKKHPS